MEDEFGIGVRWMPDSAEYNEASKVVKERRFRRAVDNLERLVVQRLFELTKLGMSGLGTSSRSFVLRPDLRYRLTFIWQGTR